MPDLQDQVTKYLADAHAIEVQALAQLRTAPDIAGDEELSAMYREHLIETEGHERATRNALAARGAKPSRTNDTVMAIGGKGFVMFARLQPDTPGKLHAHALSYEALELSSRAPAHGRRARRGASGRRYHASDSRRRALDDCEARGHVRRRRRRVASRGGPR